MQQPFGDGVTVPLYLLGQAAAGSAGVVFNGEGGDQLFGGWVNKPLVAAELYGAGDYDREAAYLRSFHRFYGMTDSLYTPRARAAVGAPDVGAWIRPALNADGFMSLLHRLRAANLWLKGAQNIAPRCVQLAAAHGLRVRAPFLDRALTEWSFRLPPEWFLHGACEKHLLKRAAEPYLPSEVVWREKRGMGVPVTEWCLGPLRREVARRLSPSPAEAGRLVRTGRHCGTAPGRRPPGRIPPPPRRREALGAAHAAGLAGGPAIGPGDAPFRDGRPVRRWSASSVPSARRAA
jgi:asparagine synthase (glutamine-hydrolysing)